MIWTIDDGLQSRQIESVASIADTVKNVIERKSEFIILSPSEPEKACNFMQAVSVGTEEIHFEVSMLLPTGKNRTYSKVCTSDVAIRMFTLFFTEKMVPDVTDWKFEGEFG